MERPMERPQPSPDTSSLHALEGHPELRVPFLFEVAVTASLPSVSGISHEAAVHQNAVALRAFTWAIEAEKSHARLSTEAIALVAAGKKDAGVGTARFFACTACGYTSERPEEHERCPVRNLSWDKFEIVR